VDCRSIHDAANCAGDALVSSRRDQFHVRRPDAEQQFLPGGSLLTPAIVTFMQDRVGSSFVREWDAVAGAPFRDLAGSTPLAALIATLVAALAPLVAALAPLVAALATLVAALATLVAALAPLVSGAARTLEVALWVATLALRAGFTTLASDLFLLLVVHGRESAIARALALVSSLIA
jgi:hypothetical protein